MIDPYHPSALVRVNFGMWKDSLGIVIGHDQSLLHVRLGNGNIIHVCSSHIEAVEYRPGSGCPATFPEEFKVRR
jgi:hypothetical protein